MLDQIFRNWIDNWVLVVLILILSWLLWRYLTTPKNLPPGPWGLPIVGYIPFLGDKPHMQLAGLRKQYGDVVTISIGPYRAIVLNSFNAVKNALVKQADVFSARPTGFTPKEFRKYRGIVDGNGQIWSEFRRFSISTLKDFGFGRSTIEPHIRDEIYNLIKEIESHEGKPADIGNTLRMSITNVICSIVTGRRFEYNDPSFVELVKVSDELVTGIGFTNLEHAVPDFLREPKLLKFFGIRSGIAAGVKLRQLLDGIIEKYDKNHQPGSQDNFIDAWLTEMERQGPSQQFFDKQQLTPVLQDLFIAGSDTTSNTIRWGLLYMMKHPEIQQKVQQEIDEVVGRERSPAMTDQKNMPYTEATIMEVSRIATIVPLSITHSTHRDTSLNGYFIPQGVLIMPNLWAVHHDPHVFPNPHDFKPERFLTDNNQVKKMEEVIPFSMGKRQCMGEALARMELFLYFTSILQHFNIKKVEGSEVSFDHHFAVISVPNSYKLCAIKR